jgi:hypothetical protein
MTGRVAMVVAVLAVASCRSGAPVREPASTAARYAVPARVGDLVVDAALFARFADPVRRDAEAAVRLRGDAGAKDELFVLAILDALDDRWPAAVASLDRIRAVEADPVKAAMTGLSIRVGADARAHGGATADAYAAALERALAGLPFDRVRDELAMLRAMAQAFTPEVCRGLVDESIGPHVRAGSVGFEDAATIVFQRYAAVVLAPVGAVIERVLAVHGVGLPPS